MALTSCCGCFNLKTGTISIGVLSIISTVISFIMTILAICQFEQDPNIRYSHEATYFPIRAMFISALGYIAFLFSCALMLVIGANNRKANLVFPYLCLGFASIVVLIAAALGLFSYMMMSPYVPISAASVVTFIVSSALALKIYLWLVIYHFYQELLAEKFGRKINPATGKILREPFEQDV